MIRSYVVSTFLLGIFSFVHRGGGLCQTHGVSFRGAKQRTTRDGRV